jgi:hypothetical protein
MSFRKSKPRGILDLPRSTWPLESAWAGGSPLPAENEAFGLQSAEVKVVKTLDEAVRQLKREPGQPVRATVEGLTVEVRVVPELPVNRSAAELFAEIGPWEGETTDEMLQFLAEARRS